MKKVYNFAGIMRKFSGILLLAVTVVSSSCLKKVEHNPSDTKETAFMYIMNSYARSNGTATFKALADNALLLSNTSILARNKIETEELDASDVKSICNYWVSARDNWFRVLCLPVMSEEDEALFRNIGTWPADTTGIKETIAKIGGGESLNLSELPQNQRGFSAAEFLLYQIRDGKSEQHSPDYSASQLDYLCAVTEEIKVASTLLYANWAGSENLADSYASLLQRYSLTAQTRGYAWELLNPGQDESRFATYQEALLKLIDGCIAFVEEFGKNMLGKELATVSRNSVTDYKSAFGGISSCYNGKISGQASLSTYTKAWNAELDTEIKAQLTDIQSRINKLTEPVADSEEDLTALSSAISETLVQSLTALRDFIQSL